MGLMPGLAPQPPPPRSNGKRAPHLDARQVQDSPRAPQQVSKASDWPVGLAARPALCPFTVCRRRAPEVCAPGKQVAGVQRLTGPRLAPHTAGSEVLEGNVLCGGRCREAFGA